MRETPKVWKLLTKVSRKNNVRTPIIKSETVTYSVKNNISAITNWQLPAAITTPPSAPSISHAEVAKLQDLNRDFVTLVLFLFFLLLPLFSYFVLYFSFYVIDQASFFSSFRLTLPVHTTTVYCYLFILIGLPFLLFFFFYVLFSHIY